MGAEASGPEPVSIIRSYLLLTGLYTLSASIIWGVNTLFLLDAGLNLLQVFIANAVFTGSMALFEIPTGVLADTRGRRISFLLSLLILATGTVGYVGVAAAGGGLAWFVVFSVALGLGFTFYSGAMEAWLVDALIERGFSGRLDQVFARASIASGGAMLIGTMAGGLLGQVDLSLPFLVRAGLLILVFGIAFNRMHDIGFEKRAVPVRQLPAEMRSVARSSIRYGWQEPQIRLLIVSGALQSAYMAWGFHAWQPYFLDLLAQNLIWVSGIIAALVAFAMILGNSIVERLASYCGRRTTILLWAAGVFGIGTVGVGLANTFSLAVGLYLVTMIAYGVMGPVRQAYIHGLIPSQQRATVISFDSLVSNGGSMTGQSGLALLAQLHSISSGYIAGGLTAMVSLPVLFGLRAASGPADRIVGEAGNRGACPVQGAPGAIGIEGSLSAAAAAE